MFVRSAFATRKQSGLLIIVVSNRRQLTKQRNGCYLDKRVEGGGGLPETIAGPTLSKKRA